MSRSVFITGIGGFIGRALALRLVSAGFQVTVVSRSGSPIPGCEVIAADAMDVGAYADRLKRADALLHMASPTAAQEINRLPLEALRQNVVGLEQVLHEFAQGEGRHFLFLSTGKVYGPPKFLPITEEHPLEPTIPHGKSKKLCEELIAFYGDYSDKYFSILRVFNAYGPGQKASFVVPVILQHLSSGVVPLGDVRGKRDFIYIDDLVSAIMALIERVADNPPAKHVQIFNVGSGVSHSPADIMRELEGITGKKLEAVVDKERMRSGEPDEERADISKISLLGWTPKVSMREGLTRILQAESNVAVS